MLGGVGQGFLDGPVQGLLHHRRQELGAAGDGERHVMVGRPGAVDQLGQTRGVRLRCAGRALVITVGGQHPEDLARPLRPATTRPPPDTPVADDSELVRRGLSEIIESGEGIHVIAEAWDGRTAVEAARRYTPDIVLIDIRMPGLEGLTTTRHIRKLPQAPRVVILTTFSEDEYVDEAIRAGASGFLLKDTPPPWPAAGPPWTPPSRGAS